MIRYVLVAFWISSSTFLTDPKYGNVFGLVPHYEAIQTILAAVQMGEGVIKVTGEVGTGKTMVCRKLIELIESQVELVYLPILCSTESNYSLPWQES